jgi:hypothetical protein
MNYRGILYDLQKRHNKYSLQCYDSPFFHILYAPFLGIGRICNANLWYFCSSHKDERRPVYATVDIWWIAPKGKNVSTTNTRFHPRSQLQHGILGFFAHLGRLWKRRVFFFFLGAVCRIPAKIQKFTIQEQRRAHGSQPSRCVTSVIITFADPRRTLISAWAVETIRQDYSPTRHHTTNIFLLSHAGRVVFA